MEHLITFVVGDYDGMGHNKSVEFLISSNKSAEEVAVAHNGMKKLFGFTIHDICGNFGQCIASPGHMSDLVHVWGYKPVGGSHYMDRWYPDAVSMCDLWMFMLMKVDLDLSLKAKKSPDTLNRYITQPENSSRFVGYGIFD